jgi:hypothetical protein
MKYELVINLEDRQSAKLATKPAPIGVRIDYRWAGSDVDRLRRYAMCL